MANQTELLDSDRTAIITERNALMRVVDNMRRDRNRLWNHMLALEAKRKELEATITALEEVCVKAHEESSESDRMVEVYRKQVLEHDKEMKDVRAELLHATTHLERERNRNVNAPQLLIDQLQRRDLAIQHIQADLNTATEIIARLEQQNDELLLSAETSKSSVAALEQQNAELQLALQMSKLGTADTSTDDKKRKGWRGSVKKWM